MKVLLGCLAVVLLASPFAAEEQDIPTLRRNALEAYESEEYAAAAKYFALVAAAGADAAANYYNAACSHSLSGQVDQAFDALDLALEAGYGNYTNMSGDTDLENLRGDPRFERILDRIADEEIVITDKLQHTADEAEFVFADAHNFVRAMQASKRVKFVFAKGLCADRQPVRPAAIKTFQHLTACLRRVDLDGELLCFRKSA